MQQVKKINIDAIQGLMEPIELTLGGQTYTIREFNDEMLRRVNSLSEEAAEGEALHDVLSNQLAILTGTDAEQFLKLDGRLLVAAVRRVMDVLTKAGEDASRRQRRGR